MDLEVALSAGREDTANQVCVLALQRQSDDLRQRLIEACATIGFDPPIPSNFTLPPL